ncbi:hypothetical protein QJQ45_006483 [Haematococcus lacustris]|nr:hypothetical protein QJQ45_006483 [Haematococcus lacustris]
MLLQWYNKKQLPPSVVMKKALASKFKDTWEFQYGSDELVYAHCKACPREDGDVRDVSNMSQTSRQQHEPNKQATCLWDFTAREDYPLFSEAATRLLSMHITTAAEERNWSAWGDTFEAGRAQLGIKKAEMMVYIHANVPKGAFTMPSELVALGITA